jgi:hypothetical protein
MTQPSLFPENFIFIPQKQPEILDKNKTNNQCNTQDVKTTFP